MPHFSKTTNSKRQRSSDTPFKWMFQRASNCPPVNAIERHGATGSKMETFFTLIVIVGVLAALIGVGMKFGQDQAGKPGQTPPTAIR